jgi:hypothetical protein
VERACTRGKMSAGGMSRAHGMLVTSPNGTHVRNGRMPSALDLDGRCKRRNPGNRKLGRPQDAEAEIQRCCTARDNDADS